MNALIDKRKRYIFIFLAPIALVFLYIYFQVFKPARIEENLLKPKIIMPKSECLTALKVNELESIVSSINSPNQIPIGLESFEFSAEQVRPSIHFSDACIIKANEIISKPTPDFNLFKKENTLIWNEAYSRTGSTKYINFALNLVNTTPAIENESLIYACDIIRYQRQAIPFSDTESYIKAVANIKNRVNTQIETKNPITALELLLITNSLPFIDFKEEVFNKLKAVFYKALVNKNDSRTDGLFLSPEESTYFSSLLIKLAWDFYIQKMKMPDWLTEIAEKEACRLAYRLEQDGCLPTWVLNEERINRNEAIYKAALIFNRDDLRYISFNGLRVPNSYPPQQCDFEFKELGIFIFRTAWNHSALTNPFEPFKNEELQITYDRNQEMISISLGTITQLVFQTSQKFESLLEFKNCFKFHHKQEGKICNCNNVVCDYMLEVDGLDLHLVKISKPYLLESEDNIKSYHIFWKESKHTDLKNTFDIEIKRGEKNFIKEIHFNTRRNG